MSHLPLVTIVCSCYNHEKFVRESLDSMVNQTYSNLELIIVDDFSTDNSVFEIESWLKQHDNVKFFQNTENLGITKSFNRAAQEITGAYFIDLAADDVLLPNCVEELLNVYLNSGDENLAIVYANADKVDHTGTYISTMYDFEMINKIKKATDENFYWYLLKDSSYICSVSAMYKTHCFNLQLGYDENLIFEDFDYWLRTTKNWNIKFTNKTLVEKRVLRNSLGSGLENDTKQTNQLNVSFYRILQKAFKLNTEKKEYLALLKRIWYHGGWSFEFGSLSFFMGYTWLFFKSMLKYSFAKSN